MSKEYKKRINSEQMHSESPVETQSEQAVSNSAMQDIPSPTSSSMGRTVSMPTKLRQRMESSFGADFSGIEMFESEEVGSRGADAVTLGGGKIGFAPGKLDFSSQSGQELIGHELAHVVSHARGEVKGSGFLGDSALESQADRQGAMAAAGQSVYNGPVTPISASSVASAEGPIQAKKGKKAQMMTKEETAAFAEQRKETSDKAMAGMLSNLTPEYAQKMGFTDKDYAILNKMVGGRAAEDSAQRMEEKKNMDRDNIKAAGFRENQQSIKNMANLTQHYLKLSGGDKRMQAAAGGDSRALYNAALASADDKNIQGLYSHFAHSMDNVDFDDKERAQLMFNNFALRAAMPFASDTIAKIDMADPRRKAVLANSASAMRALNLKQEGLDDAGLTEADVYNDAVTAFGGVSDRSKAKKGSLAFENGKKDRKLKTANEYNPISNSQNKNTTAEGVQAQKDYIMDSRDINGYLRTGAVNGKKSKEELDAMSNALSSNMQTLDSDQSTFRGISDAGLLPLISQLGMEDTLINANGTINHQALMANKDLLKNMTFTDNTFVSTTASKDFAEEWGANLPRRDLNFFKSRALERHQLTDAEKSDSRNSGLLQMASDPKVSTMYKQQALAGVADNVLSKSENVQESDIGTHIMNIALPKGSKASYIDRANGIKDLSENSAMNQQFEVLLNKGSTFRIKDIVQRMDEEGNAIPNQLEFMLELIEAEEEGQKKAPSTSAQTSASSQSSPSASGSGSLGNGFFRKPAPPGGWGRKKR